MTAKKEMINKISRALSKEIEFVRLSSNKTTDEKIQQIDVLNDTMHFLRDYDKNVNILNKYIASNKYEREK